VRIGVVSDTHDRLPNVARIVELFAAARVERVVHTGDITKPRTLVALARLGAPVSGVFGNNDREREALEAAAATHGCDFAESGRTLELAERRILVVHDPREIEAGLAGHTVVLHGHDHRRRIERRDGALIVNPGECAGFLPGHNAVAVVDLAALAVQVLLF
jgi:putative phosphoesterase